MYEIQGATHMVVPLAGYRAGFKGAALDVFGNHRSHLNSDHAEFSDLTDLIDHRESDSDLCFTVNPDGG